MGNEDEYSSLGEERCWVNIMGEKMEKGAASRKYFQSRITSI